MEDSDDEDPLALLPRQRFRNTVPHKPSGKTDVEAMTTGAAVVDVVPTSDSEEAQEDLIRSKGWESYLASLDSPLRPSLEGSAGPDFIGDESRLVGTLIAASRLLDLLEL
jgi:hypothetical protein